MNEKDTARTEETLPRRAIVLPLLERPLFPETFTTLMIGRPSDVQVISKAIDSDGYFVALMQDENSGYKNVGTLARASRFIRLPAPCGAEKFQSLFPFPIPKRIPSFILTGIRTFSPFLAEIAPFLSILHFSVSSI